LIPRKTREKKKLTASSRRRRFGPEREENKVTGGLGENRFQYTSIRGGASPKRDSHHEVAPESKMERSTGTLQEGEGRKLGASEKK